MNEALTRLSCKSWGAQGRWEHLPFPVALLLPHSCSDALHYPERGLWIRYRLFWTTPHGSPHFFCEIIHGQGSAQEASTSCPSFPSSVLGKLQEVVVIPSFLIVVFLKAETEKRVLHDQKEKHTWERRVGTWTTHLTWRLQRRAVMKSCHFSLLPLAHRCRAQGAVDPSPKCHYTAPKPPAKLWVSTTIDLWVVCSQ